MEQSDAKRLHARLLEVGDRQPVATVQMNDGSVIAGDVTSFGPKHIVLLDCIEKRTRTLELAKVHRVSLVAIRHPNETFGGRGDPSEGSARA